VVLAHGAPVSRFRVACRTPLGPAQENQAIPSLARGRADIPSSRHGHLRSAGAHDVRGALSEEDHGLGDYRGNGLTAARGPFLGARLSARAPADRVLRVFGSARLLAPRERGAAPGTVAATPARTVLAGGVGPAANRRRRSGRLARGYPSFSPDALA